MKRKIIWIVLLFLALIAGTAVFTVTTEQGLRWVVARLIKNIPGELSFEKLQGRLAGQITVQGLRYKSGASLYTIDKLSFDLQLMDLLNGTLHVTTIEGTGIRTAQEPTLQPFNIPSITADSITINRRVTIEKLQIDSPDYSLSASGSVKLQDNFPIDLATTWRVNVPGYTVISGDGKLTGDLHKLELNQTISTPFAALIHITGNIEQYQFELTTDLKNIPQFPPGKWTAAGHGGHNDITFTRIDGEMLDGKIHGQGKLNWQPQLAWQFKVDGQDINPGKQWPDWPGTMAFAATVDGRTENGGLYSTLTLDKASGKIRDYPVTAQGRLEMTPDGKRLADLKIDSGNNILTASGTLSDHWDFKWNIDAPEINALLPSAHGVIHSKGHLTGPQKTPHIAMTIHGQKVSYNGTTAEALDVAADIDLISTVSSSLKLDARDITTGKLNFDKFELRASGTLQEHDLHARLNSRYTSTMINANAGFKDNTWSGNVSAADWTSSDYGAWKLGIPLRFTVTASAATIEKACWVNLSSQLCGEGDWHYDTGGHLVVSGKELPMTFARAILPPGLDVIGTLDMQGDFDIDTEYNVLGSAQLHTGNGRLSHILTTGSEITIDYADASIQAQASRDRISAQASLNISQGDFIKGSIVLSNTVLTLGRRIELKNAPVEGQLLAKLGDLELLPYLIPEIETTSGAINIDLSLSGTSSLPQVKGAIRLDNAAAEIPRAGLHLTNIQLLATSDDSSTLKITSQSQSGKGTLAIDGTMRWDAQDRLKASFAVTGKQFEIVRIPEVWVTASPDLTIDITHNRIDINGSVHIPEALIEPRDLTATRRPSADVVIANGESAEERQRRWQIHSLVNFSLGEKVKFDGFGLVGDIGGNVAMIDSPAQLTTAYGQLQINNGSYHAYGRKLDIEKGRLLFVGGPSDNPGLDIRATQHTDNIITGINVRGTLQAPRLSIFSEPAMAESDALSYLILGRPMNQASQAEGEVLFGAATSLGLASSELLAKQIGKAFQIDEVRIESGNNLEEATLVVGKYLMPRLYVSYGIGLIEPINTFRLRYKLSSKWNLQTESGLNTGADLFFTLEK